jgi:hypothetical protein
MVTHSRSYQGPQDPEFAKQVAEAAMVPLQDCLSGEISVDSYGRPLGLTRFDGRVARVYMTEGDCGRDDTDDLYAEADVFINGVTCLTTKPKIEANDGSASEVKTTLGGTDTGVTEAVVSSANSFSPGDHISWEFTLERTTPDTEIGNPCICVELLPN